MINWLLNLFNVKGSMSNNTCSKCGAFAYCTNVESPYSYDMATINTTVPICSKCLSGQEYLAK